MAEIVNKNSEEILPQFEELNKLELFSPSEMREVIQRHVEYEYKIVKREKQVSDFQEYINYKLDFLKLVRIRMKMKNVNKKERRKVENMLVKHIIKLYNTTMKYYSSNISLWLEYVDFLTKEKNYARVVIVYDSLLGFHMGNEELFVRAAKFMIKYIKDIDLTRKTLFKGIRLHKRSQLLYLEFFKIELEYAARKRRECEKESEKLASDPVLCGKTAEAICEWALKVIDDLKFKLSLLETCAQYKFMRSLQKELYRILQDQHYFNAEMWNSIAQLQLNNVSFESIDMSGLKSRDPFKQKVWRCFHIFLRAVKAVPNETMWYYYIDTFFNLLQSNPEKFDYIYKFLLKLLPRSNSQNLLKEESYLHWIENSERHYSIDKLIEFINGLLKLYPRNADLWLKKLQYHVSQMDATEFRELLNEALQNLKDQDSQYKLWQFVLQSSTNISADDINIIFEKRLAESPSNLTLRLLYLDWIIAKNDVTLARSSFSNVLQTPPYDLHSYQKVINFEVSQPDVDVKQVRHLFNMMCLYFGSSQPATWIDYMEFEKNYGDVSCVTSIYWKAVKQLEPSLSDKFIVGYSLLKAT